jgi:hypothetical protein
MGNEFRPDFKKVGELTCIFENNPDNVWANPDILNIYIKIEKKLPNIKKLGNMMI